MPKKGQDENLGDPAPGLRSTLIHPGAAIVGNLKRGPGGGGHSRKQSLNTQESKYERKGGCAWETTEGQENGKGCLQGRRKRELKVGGTVEWGDLRKREDAEHRRRGPGGVSSLPSSSFSPGCQVASVRGSRAVGNVKKKEKEEIAFRERKRLCFPLGLPICHLTRLPRFLIHPLPLKPT